jgi:hypothetical protein
LVEDDVHDPLRLLELHRVQGAGDFDISVMFARDLEGKARAGKIHQSDVEVADIAVVMCLDVALPVIQRLELALNDEIGAIRPAVLARILGVKRDLVIVTGFAGGDVFCVKSHEVRCALRQALIQ